MTLTSRGVLALLKSTEVRTVLEPYAQRVASAARASAPVDTGEYRDSIITVSATTDRAVERVVTTAPHGMVVEARTGNLARALDRA